jgi:hypothetical protein
MTELQTCGSYDGTTDAYSVSFAQGNLCVTLDGLSYHDVEALADLAYCLLYRDGEPYTWSNEFEPNDVY